MRRAWIDLAARVKHRLVGPRFPYQSETANDRWIVEHVFPGKRNGYFVEAGAANGRIGSSCYVLEKHLGWTGICVEPNDDFFPELVRSRPNSIHENICLSAKPGVVSFVEGVGDAAQPYLSGIRDNLLQKTGGPDVVASGRMTQKQAFPLAEILDKHSAPAVIDYGAFDMEGSEFEVLEVFPFSRYSFRALSLELDKSTHDPVSRLLADAGYREVQNPFNRTRPWERYWVNGDMGLAG
jgi:hypothetical protein